MNVGARVRNHTLMTEISTLCTLVTINPSVILINNEAGRLKVNSVDFRLPSLDKLVLVLYYAQIPYYARIPYYTRIPYYARIPYRKLGQYLIVIMLVLECGKKGSHSPDLIEITSQTPLTDSCGM